MRAPALIPRDRHGDWDRHAVSTRVLQIGVNTVKHIFTPDPINRQVAKTGRGVRASATKTRCDGRYASKEKPLYP